jgi:membrane protein involved in colicin uptake
VKSTDADHTELAEQVTALTERATRISASLADAGRGLMERRALPPETLVEEVASVHTEFAALRDRVVAAATMLAAGAPPPVTTLRELEVLVKVLVEQDVRRARRPSAEPEPARPAVDAKRKAPEAPPRKAQEDTRRKAAEAEQGWRQAEAEAKRKSEEEAQRRAAEEARHKTEDEARHKAAAEAEARRKAEDEARRKDVDAEAARQKTDVEAKRKAQEEAKRKAEEEGKRKAEDEAKRKAEAEGKRKGEEEARRKAEEEGKRKAEEEVRRKAAEAEAKRKADQEAQQEAQRRTAEEAKRKAEEDVKRKAEEETKRKTEEEGKRKAEEETRRKAADAEAKRKADQEAQQEAQRRAAEEARRREQEVAAAATAPSAEPVAEDDGGDAGLETAQWWISSSANWGSMRSKKVAFAASVSDVLTKYPYFLSVPIQTSADYEDGMLAYGYGLLLEHVEQSVPGFVSDALSRLPARAGVSLGRRLYDYLAQALGTGYGEFIKNVMVAGLPRTPPWATGGIEDSETTTTVFVRPSARIGDTHQKAERFTQASQRFGEHHFTAAVPPLTTRFFRIEALDVKEARHLGLRISEKGVPSDQAWVVSLAARGGAPQAKRHVPQGTVINAIGRDVSSVWVGLFNADAETEKRFDMAVEVTRRTPGATGGFRKSR